MIWNILKLVRKREPVLSDVALAEWMLKNGFFRMIPTQYRTHEQVCLWMIQRIKNKKNAMKWVYTTMKLQELKNNPPDRISNPNEFMKQFEDELSGKDRYKDVSMHLSAGRPFTEYLDGVIYPRIYGLMAAMSECGKHKGAWIEYVSGYPARP